VEKDEEEVVVCGEEAELVDEPDDTPL